MTEEETSYIDWIELAKDYQMTEGITEDQMNWYEELIRKRQQEDNNGKEMR